MPRVLVLAALAGLAGTAFGQTARVQMVTPNTPRVTYPSAPTWGVGAGRMNINLLSTNRFERWDSVPVMPTPRPTPRPPYTGAVPSHPATGVWGHSSTGSGLTVDGRYSGDKWNVGVHVGNGTHGVHTGEAGQNDHVVMLPAHTNRYSGVYWGSYRSYRTGASPTTLYRGDGPLDPRLFQTTPPTNTRPAATDPEPTTPATILDTGLMALREGEYTLAVAALRKHLREKPDDGHAMRALAVALIETKALDDASGMMRQAYRTDTHLVAEPLFPASLAYTDKAYRSLVTRTVAYAHRVDTASAWLVVSVLMQGEGRDANAKAMLEKAAKVGLEQTIADGLRAEFK